MRAIGVYQFGGPDALQVVDLPEPHVGPGQLGIRVRAATVNPTDTALRSGARAQQLRDVPPPHVPGMEVAGVLERVGAGVSTDLEPGDRVMAIVAPRGAHGAYAEHVAVPAESVVRTPVGSTDAEAATLPMNGLTARHALDLLGLVPGQRIGVTGSAGALGGYVIQLAKTEGLEVVADAGPSDEELVRSLGADTIVRRGPDVADRIREVAPDGVDGLVDAAVLNEAVARGARRWAGDHRAWVRGRDRARGHPAARLGAGVPAEARRIGRATRASRARRAQPEGGPSLSGRPGVGGPPAARGRRHAGSPRSRVLTRGTVAGGPEPQRGEPVAGRRAERLQAASSRRYRRYHSSYVRRSRSPGQLAGRSWRGRSGSAWK